MRRNGRVVNRERRTSRWTEDEDQMLLRQVRAFPQNLHRCFLMVSESTGRTEKAVQAHWYTVVSKRPDAMCFFTASPRHVSKNRKNGMGVESNSSIWRRLMAIIKGLV